MATNYRFSFLQDKDIPNLRQTFVKAFADYIVPIQMTEDQFLIKLKREGIELTFCGGVYCGDELVAFILTGLGEWKGKPTAYNGGTGVVPEHRGKGLTKQLYNFMLPKLRESGIEQCLLEVIEGNEPALKVYQSVGFNITRSLDCFRGRKEELDLPDTSGQGVTIKEALRPEWSAYVEFCDVELTWQNTVQAIRKSPDRKIILEAWVDEKLLVGYIIFFPKTGAIAQMAVSPGYRDKGVATALLREAVVHSEAPALMLINVDTACKDFLALMERRHFTRILGQYEMLMSI